MSFILPVLKHFQLFMAIQHTLYTVYVILTRGGRFIGVKNNLTKNDILKEMAKILNNKQSAIQMYPRVTAVSPYPTRLMLHYISIFDEINELKKRIDQLENREKVIILKEMTREEAKKAIRKLFSSGRTLYYSDIVQELGIGLETVVDICNELEEEKEIAIDAGVSE